MTDPKKPAAAQSDAPSAEQIQEAATWRTNNVEWEWYEHTDKVAEVLATYAAMRTAQLTTNLSEMTYKLADYIKENIDLKFRTAQLERKHEAIAEGQRLIIENSKVKLATAESALVDAKKLAIQECIKIADERATKNMVHSLKFAAPDQKNMYERAIANAGEAERIADSLRALLTVAAPAEQIQSQKGETNG